MKTLTFKKSESFKSTSDERGSLSAFNIIEKFPTQRAFLATCKKGNWRGKHYHKETTQMILVLSGELSVKVTSTDGDISVGVMTEGTCHKRVPYTQFEFCSITEESKILVLCDTTHDPSDYYVLSDQSL